MTFGSQEGMNERADELIDAMRNAARPLLIVISGPSGVGKDTVIERMREVMPECYYAVTATTRERRPGEINGVHYHFFTPEDFNRDVEAGEFLEHATVYGNLYGVPKVRVRQALRQGKDVVIKVDPQGAATIRRLAPEALMIFLLPPDMGELSRRLRSRKTDDPLALSRRINIASREIATSELFDYFVINESEQIGLAVEQIQQIVTVEKLRIHPREVDL
jgi:guanylate kinase